MTKKEKEAWKKLWAEHEEECWREIIKAIQDESKFIEILETLKKNLSEEEFNEFCENMKKICEPPIEE